MKKHYVTLTRDNSRGRLFSKSISADRILPGSDAVTTIVNRSTHEKGLRRAAVRLRENTPGTIANKR